MELIYIYLYWVYCGLLNRYLFNYMDNKPAFPKNICIDSI